MHDFIILCIGHLESIDPLRYADLQNVDTVWHTIKKGIHSLISSLITRVSQSSRSVVLSFLKFSFFSLKTHILSLSTNLSFSVIILEVRRSLFSQIRITTLSVVRSNKSGVL